MKIARHPDEKGNRGAGAPVAVTMHRWVDGTGSLDQGSAAA